MGLNLISVMVWVWNFWRLHFQKNQKSKIEMFTCGTECVDVECRPRFWSSSSSTHIGCKQILVPEQKTLWSRHQWYAIEWLLFHLQTRSRHNCFAKKRVRKSFSMTTGKAAQHSPVNVYTDDKAKRLMRTFRGSLAFSFLVTWFDIVITRPGNEMAKEMVGFSCLRQLLKSKASCWMVTNKPILCSLLLCSRYLRYRQTWTLRKSLALPFL